MTTTGDNMKYSILRAAVLLGNALLLGLAIPVAAQEVIKIGVVAPYTGPFAIAGQSYRQGIEAYMAQKGRVGGGRKVGVLYRDSAGADPTLAKRLAEELVVKDKASILIGFYLSPEV